MPSHLTVQLIVLSSCAVCKLIGELCWHDAQRYIMPIIIGIGISIVTGVWWLGFCALPTIGPIDLGYKTFGSSDGFNRGMWLFLILAVLGLPFALLHHLSWWFYVPWCIVGGIWGATTRGLWNVLIAPITGLLIGLIIFFVR